MFMLTLSEFKNGIKVDEPKPCEGWYKFTRCPNVGVKLIELKNCGCKTGNAWLCNTCIKTMTNRWG